MSRNTIGTVLIDIAADTSKLVAGFDKAQREAKDKSERIVGYAKNIGTAFAGLASAGAITAVIRGSVDEFKKLENAQIKVQKTTGLAGAEFDKLTKRIDVMSTVMNGVEVTGLYDIAEAAGQLGITGVKNIVEFTRVMAMVGLTTDLTEQQASISFAKLSNQLGEPTDKVERLASVFNELSNTTEANVGDLLAFSGRIAGAGKTANYSTAEIAALSATMTGLGINFESGGSAISRTMLLMAKDSDKFANAMGINAERYATVLQNKPMKALQQMFTFMSKLNATDRIKFLTQVQLDGVESASVLLRIANATDKLSKNLKIANDEYDVGTSLQNEYTTASQGMDAQLKTMENSFVLLGASIGSKFKEPILESADALTILSGEMTKVFDGTSAYMTEVDFIVATTSRTVDMFNLLYETVENTGQNAISGIALLVYGTLAPISHMLSETTKGLNSIGLSSNENVQSALRLESNLYGAVAKAQKDIEDNTSEITDALYKANVPIEDRVLLYQKERRELSNNLKTVKQVANETKNALAVSSMQQGQAHLSTTLSAKDIAKQAAQYEKVYATMLNIQGSGYDKYLYKLGNELVDLGENGATVQQQLQYYDYQMNKFATEATYSDWLEMVNEQLIAMANNQASVNDMVAKYNELSAQRAEAQAYAGKATISDIVANPEAYANADFSNYAAGALGTDVKDSNINSNVSTYNAPVYNAPIYNNTTQSQSNYDPNNTLGLAPIAPQASEAMIQNAGLAANIARASLTSGMRQLSVFEENRVLAMSKRALDEQLRQTDEWKKYEENLKAYHEAVAARKEAEELEKYASAVASTVASLNTVLGNFKDGISALNNSIGTLTSFQDAISSYTASDLQTLFYDSLSTVKSLETTLQSDPTNIDAINAYDKATANYTKYGTQYLQTQNFATSQDYEFAKAVASNSTTSFLETASTTDILLQQLADLTQTTNDALADGNITAEEAKAINAQATDILSTGTLNTTDSAAYSWLNLIKIATADGTVTLDELKSINTATNNTIAAQATPISDTAVNTGKIGRYNVSNTYGMVQDPNNPNTSYFEIISQTYTPYASGGFTGSGFGIADNTGYKPAGIVHENEWVAPEWMLNSNPALFATLEAMRRSKGALNGFAIGGHTSSPALGNNISRVRFDMQENKIVDELQTLNKRVESLEKINQAIALYFQEKVELDKRTAQEARRALA